MRKESDTVHLVLGFMGVVLLTGIIQNMCNTFWHLRASRVVNDVEGSGQARSPLTGLVANSWRSVRAHLVLPSVIATYRRRLLYGFTVPTRIEAFVVWAYWIISLILCSVNYKTFKGNL